jgi:hypothetical protein
MRKSKTSKKPKPTKSAQTTNTPPSKPYVHPIVAIGHAPTGNAVIDLQDSEDRWRAFLVAESRRIREEELAKEAAKKK